MPATAEKHTTNANLVDELAARGLLQDSTDRTSLIAHLKTPRTVYCGFDPTADSLHIGHLVPLLMLRRFQQAGHTPIALVGGATGLIGDPSFKATERTLNSLEVVQAWSAGIKAQASRFLAFEGSNAAIVANNYDWMGGMNVIAFLRDVGKHFSVNAMIAKESVKQRINREGVGISYTEFSYSLLQAYDFVELHRRHGCTMQVGGSDQWGNITAGIDLVRRMEGHAVETHALTVPLITKADGTKFGKTEGGAVWLDAARTSPYSFYQFWLNVADTDVEKFMLYFSFKPVADIKAICATHAEAPHKRTAQQALAEEMTEMVHGKPGLESAQRITEAFFGTAPGALSAADVAQVKHDQSICRIFRPGELAEHPTVVDLAIALGLAKSKREAREFVQNGAISAGGDKVTDAGLASAVLFADHGFVLLRRGKKNAALAVLEG